MPLLASSVSLNSSENSKLLYCLFVMISPPNSDSPPPDDTALRSPSSTFQPFSGKFSLYTPLQPSVVCPSKRRTQPCSFSSLVRVLICCVSVVFGAFSGSTCCSEEDSFELHPATPSSTTSAIALRRRCRFTGR